MDRLIRFNVVATSGRAVEAAGDVTRCCSTRPAPLRSATACAAGLYPVPGVSERDLAEAAVLSSLGDDTPEGRSIISFVRDRFGISPERPPMRWSFRSRRIRGTRASITERNRGARCRGQHPEAHRRHAARRLCPGGGSRRPCRQHAAGGDRGQPAARPDRAQGYRQTRHPPALRRTAPHGHPHRDGDRRQPRHRSRYRHRTGSTISLPRQHRPTS